MKEFCFPLSKFDKLMQREAVGHEKHNGRKGDVELEEELDESARQKHSKL